MNVGFPKKPTGAGGTARRRCCTKQCRISPVFFPRTVCTGESRISPFSGPLLAPDRPHVRRDRVRRTQGGRFARPDQSRRGGRFSRGMTGMAAYVRRWDRSAPAPDRNRSAGDRPEPGTGAPQTAERLPAASRSGRDPGARRDFRNAPPSGQLRLPGQAPFFLRTQCAGSGRRLILTATGGTAPRTVPGSPVPPRCFRTCRLRRRGPTPGALEDRSPPAVLSFMRQTSPSADPGGPVEPSGWARGRCADPEAAHACGFRPDGRPPAPAAQRSGGAKTGEA